MYGFHKASIQCVEIEPFTGLHQLEVLIFFQHVPIDILFILNDAY